MYYISYILYYIYACSTAATRKSYNSNAKNGNRYHFTTHHFHVDIVTSRGVVEYLY